MKKQLSGRVVVAACAVVAGLYGTSARATTQTWDGDGTTATDDVTFGTAPIDTVPTDPSVPVPPAPLPFKLWTTGDNWVSGTPAGAGDDAVFGQPAAGGSMKVAILGNVQVQTISLNDPAPGVTQGFATNVNYEFDAYSGAGNKITLGAGGSITQNAVPGASNSTPTTFRAPIDLAGAATITNKQASYLVMRGPITGVAATRQTLTIDSQSNTLVFSAISGNLDFVKTGSPPNTALTLGLAATATSPAGPGSTYLGDTFLQIGTTILKVNNTLPVTTRVSMGNGSTGAADLRLDLIQQTISGLSTPTGQSGNARILAGGDATSLSTLTLNNSAYNNFFGILGTGTNSFFNFIKTGAGGFTLSRSVSHPMTGALTIQEGAFEVEGTAAGTLNAASGITINGGRFLYSNTSSTGLNPVGSITLTSGTVGGTGRINDAVSVGASSFVSPGGDLNNTTGVFSDTAVTQFYQAGITFAPNGTYKFDATPTAGDQLTVSGAALAITATNANRFAIDINSLGVAPGTTLQRTIATSAAGITGFDPTKFIVTGGGAGSVSASGNNLILDFTTLQTIYWDIDGTTIPGAGGGASPSGNWDGTTANFSTDPLGGNAGTTVAATAPFHVVTFSAGGNATNAYTVTLTGTQSAAAVNVEEGTVTLTGGTLATGAFGVAAGAGATVASVVTGGASSAIVKSGPGTLTLSAANTHTAGTSVVGGTLVAGNADAFNAGSLSVSNGATARLQAGLSKAVTVSAVSTTGSGQLDLTDNSMVIKSMSLTDVRTMIGNSFNAGHWNGSGGLTSSMAAGTTLTAIGFAQDSRFNNRAIFKGVNVSGTDILVKYTYYGDADLNGQTNLDDFSLFLNGYQNAGSTWVDGDFDYSGVTNLADFNLFLAGYQGQGASLTQLEGLINAVPMSGAERAAMIAAVEAAVPEPTGLALLGVAGAGLLGRRGRRSRH